MTEKTIFGIYDIIGNSKTNLTDSLAFNIGYYFAKNNISKNNKRFVVGFDGRLSSPNLFKALTSGIDMAGGEVCSIGLVPTPMLYFADKKFSPAGSVMVTGSHHQKDENGLKLVVNGISLQGREIENIHDAIKAKTLEYDFNHFSKIYKVNIRSFYITRVLKEIEINKKLKIIWDTNNGSAGDIMQDLISKMPNENSIINSEVNGNFPNGAPNPGISKNLNHLIEEVKKTSSDFGIAFDGDADRIAVITSSGDIIYTDHLLCIFSKEILSRKPGSIFVADIESTKSLFDYIKSYGGNIIWKSGLSNIKAKMLDSKAELAGDISGHIFFRDNYFGYDDGIYAALRLIDVISRKQLSLEDLLSDIPKTFITPQIRIKVAENKKLEIINSIKEDMNKTNISYNFYDGIKRNFSSGWWFLRASNILSEIVIRCESESEEGLLQVQNDLNTLLEKYEIKVNF